MHPFFSHLSEVPESLQADRIVVILDEVDASKDPCLTPEERNRANEITSPEARARFISARRILRFALSKWRSVDPLELKVIPDENGKPFLADEDPVYFSITHSSRHVAVAFSRNRVGLDLELEREVDAPLLAARFFSTEEAAWVGQSTDTGLFFKLWTAREAAIKADGRGLSKLLAITGVTRVGEGNADSLEIRIGDDRWEALHWMRDKIHGALAFERRPSLISWCDLS